MAETPSHDESKPVSLRDAVPAPSGPPSSSLWESLPKRPLLLVAAASGLLIACLVLTIPMARDKDDDDDLSPDELRTVVAEVVGTQIAAAQPVAVGEGGTINQAELQQMIDQAVSTQVAAQVAALVPTNTPIPPTPTFIPNPIAADDDAFLGPEDAPVVIVEFSDFQCGFCGRFYEDTLPLILENFPDQVKFVYRDFPIFGEDSIRAAMAAECAREQGKFWEMHNRLFEIHNSATRVVLDQPTVVSFAAEIDLDTAAFTECLTSNRYREEVLNDAQAAQMYGLRGTPGFVINGVVYAFGAQPFEVFDRIIQAELAALGLE